jgi:hydroxymethylglutaryl-CoA lyase
MMLDLPRFVTINEEGPREGFQIEPGPIATRDKVAFIEALAQTGVRKIDCVSFVSARRVPGMADADEVALSISRRPDVRYTGLWLNARGLERALTLPLDVVGAIRLTASDTFASLNTGMGRDETVAEQRRWLERYASRGVALEVGYVMTAFGCNFEGNVPVDDVLAMVATILSLATEFGAPVPRVYLADTVGHASPAAIERVVGSVRERWPELRLGLHLHDTRGLGIANVWAGMRMGVDHVDAACGGLGGCPFAGHAGAAGNVATEEVAFLCEELGVETGVDLDAMIECARLAESIVGHPLASKLIRGGSVRALRAKVASAR